jgi:predicted ABC-class ATPase
MALARRFINIPLRKQKREMVNIQITREICMASGTSNVQAKRTLPTACDKAVEDHTEL